MCTSRWLKIPVLLPARAHLLLLAFSIKVMPLFRSPVRTNHPILPFQKEILEFINQLNRFLPEWFQRFPWLHYNEATDSAFCFHCMKAGNIAHSSKRDDAFISRGFTNCKNATSAFKKHEERSFHNQVIFSYIASTTMW